MNLPVLVTNVGDLSNTIPHDKAGFVVEVNQAAIIEGLIQMGKAENIQRYRKGMEKEKSRFEWSYLCDNLDQF